MKLLRIVLGVVLPPLGVFLTKGWSWEFLINIGLTFLGVVPGSIHAVWVIVKHEERLARQVGVY